ncbi:hypothetical protein [Spiroplasma diminutum]|uniref:Lipoprotein n=1 Tax=Spiroplasma diminutum CUAS-1 TaxID=1276221 RepID=S5MK74_9MOLU|nr:hypothetical protein [Spiroplasma diminutum]AGR42375.1 hypothetical protein SDIMI_v3c06710 [Spiroplasma diminutum CUAS-1]
MKKMLSVWLSLGLTVSTGVSVALADENKNTNRYSKYLTSMDDFLYYRVNQSKIPSDISNEDISKALEEAFSLDEFGKNLFKKIDFEILNNENGEIDVLFMDKNNSSLLKEKIIMRFNLVLFNYDKIEEFCTVINKYLENNPFILTKNNYIQLEFEDLLKAQFKNIFDWYASSELFLDNINEFWEFLDFDPINKLESNELKAEFLNNTELKINILRDSKLIGKNKFDNYINFFSDEKLMNKEIFNWIKKNSFFTDSNIEFDKLFKIESKEKDQLTFSLSDKYFTIAKLITLNRIK